MKKRIFALAVGLLLCLPFITCCASPNGGKEIAMSGSQTFTFDSLPQNLEEMKAMPEAELKSPYQTAALTVCALRVFAANQAAGVEMLNFLRGPRPLNGQDISFLRDRFRGNRGFIVDSYFAGAVPDNEYTPDKPYRLTIFDDAHSYDAEHYVRLNLTSGGADSPRVIKLREKADGTWLLWEQSLLVMIREPKSADPWA